MDNVSSDEILRGVPGQGDAALINVALTHYGDGERTTWEQMPAVPRVGDTVFLSDDLPPMHVRSVYWAKDDAEHPGWYAELHLD